MSEQFVSLLLGLNLFEGFTEHGARSVLASGEVEQLSEGRVLFDEGTEADSVYLVLDGGIEAYVSRDGRELALGTFGPGALIGELAVLCEMPRAASTRVTEAATVLRWNAAAFRRLLLRDTRLARSVFSTALRVVMEKQQQLIEQAAQASS